MKKQVFRPSDKFIGSVRDYPEPRYRIAIQAGVRPQTFYSLIVGIIPCRSDDERILAIGKIIGVDPGDCLEQL